MLNRQIVIDSLIHIECRLWLVTACRRSTVRDPYRAFAGRRHSRGPIAEAKEWIAVTGKLEYVNEWEKTPSGGVFSLDWQSTRNPMT